MSFVWCDVWLARLLGAYKHVVQVESCCKLDYQQFGRCLYIVRLLSPYYTANEHTYANDSYRYSREEPQGEDSHPRSLYIKLDLTACPQLQLDRPQ